MSDEQQAVFGQAWEIFQKHIPPLVVIKDTPGDFQLGGNRPAIVANRKMEFVWFAALKKNKVGVTLHYMPIYYDKELGAKLPPLFMKALKGQACFHLGKFPPELQEAVETALAIGIEEFKTRGWL